MRTANSHIELLTMGVSMWTFFFIAGLPSDYYQRWGWPLQLAFIVAIPTYVLWLITKRKTARLSPGEATVRIAWTAFYFTAPFLILDVLYLGIHLGKGAEFLVSHWYLTAFYLTPWMTLPFLRWQRADQHVEAPGTGEQRDKRNTKVF